MHTTRRTALAGLTAAAVVPLTVDQAGAFAPPARTKRRHGLPRRPTLVIGHRGTAGYRPEHTLASYELAARMGADFMEPDLCATKDGYLVCRHEPEIGGTTDVSARPEFAGRRTTKSLDGAPITGWFTTDFTLAELKTLRAKERLPQVRQHNTMYDGLFEIPTFTEVLALRERISKDLGREIGVYPETKHPTFFQRLGLALEPRLLSILRRHRLNTPDAPVYVQSFEVTNLEDLRDQGLRTNAVQLLSASGSPYDSTAHGGGPSYADLIKPSGLAGVARYAQGIGPDKNLVIPRNPDTTLGQPTSLVRDAHHHGLVLHPYTFRAENTFLPADYQRGTLPTDYGRGIDEQVTFLRAGIDGVFTDQADIGVLARTFAHADQRA
ncbi:MAG: glycerophosphodiester phosphodiesterase [Nocardioides sp.]